MPSHRFDLRRISVPSVLLGIVLAAGACGADTTSSSTDVPDPQAGDTRTDRYGDPPPPTDQPYAGRYLHISGHVSLAGTGEPYPGAWVEFTTTFGENVHTTTDENGDYDLPVPEGVYTALAGDHDDLDLSFEVVGPDNVVEVPGDTRVDFVARSIAGGQ